MTSGEHPGASCIRCGKASAAESYGLCSACVVQTRIECVAGLRRFGVYLAAWAAFDEWCRSHGRGAAAA